MKKQALVMVAIALAAQTAMADGFVCQTAEGDLNVKLYNNTQPEAGTRNAAIMILSDPSVGGGNKTIAKFTDSKGTLSSREMVYSADVDLRFADSNRKGEYLVGTRLGEVDTIEAAIEFSYAAPVAADEAVEGTLTVNKRNGEVIERALLCTRYIKN